jgi:integrase/recombinase XerD
MKYNIIPGLRTDKKDKKGNVPIYVFVYQGRKQIAKHSTGEKVHPDYWDADDRRVKSRATNATLINAKIVKQIADLQAVLLTGNITTGASDAAKILQAERSKDLDFFEFAERQIKQKSYRPESRRLYTAILDKLKGFRKALKLRDVDFLFLQSFEAYLRDDLKNEHNTIWNAFKFLNTIFSDAIKAKYISEEDNPFRTYKRPRYKETIPVFLESGELEAIEDFVADTEDDGLKLVGTYFLFMCYTGLRYSDGVRFKSSLHVVGNERIVMQTTKTGTVTNLFITDQIRRLIPFIDANRLYITQVEYNRRLKIIAAGAGIRKNLTSHVARHTFGSSLVDLGVDMKVAQGLLSHGSAQSTKIYFHVKSKNLDDAMKKFNRIA